MTFEQLKEKYEGTFIGDVPYFILSLEPKNEDGYFQVKYLKDDVHICIFNTPSLKEVENVLSFHKFIC